MNYQILSGYIFMSIIIVGAISLSLFLPSVFAQLLQVDNVNDTISDTDNRKSFGYCPIDSDTQTVLIKYGVTYTIEGCPLSRVYVDNWDKLDDNTKQNIVTELESKGYRMEKE